MKVIFIEDVPNVASAGEAKEVADGYGRNFLLPRKLAVLADSQASAVVKAQLKKIALKRAQTEAEMAELAGKLDGVEVTLKAKVGEKERLYGSITSADIVDELNSSTGLVVDKRKIELEEPIRQLGSYEVTVRLTQDIAAVVKVMVVADEVAEEKGEKGTEVKKGKKAKEKGEKKAEAKAEKDEEEKVEEAKAEGESKKKVKAKARKKKEEKVEEAEDRAEEVKEKEAESGE